MNRWSSYGKLDTQLPSEEDRGYYGINMTLDRPLLPEGILARSENKRLRTGPAVTRAGTIKPDDFNPEFEDTIIGSGIFNNPNGEEVMLVATVNADYVWALQYGEDPVQIDITSGEDLTGVVAVRFVQAFDKVLLLRQPTSAGAQLVWDGVNANDFEVVVLSGTGDTIIPRTLDGQPFQNRLILYFPRWTAAPLRHTLYLTDVLDYTSYNPTDQTYTVNAGESDWITRIWPYYGNSVVVFKNNSIHILRNFTIDPTNGLLTEEKVVSTRIGCAATHCIAETGSDIIFLSRPGGFYRMKRIDPSAEIPIESAIDPTSVSDPIRPVIKRINWTGTQTWGCAQVVDDYAFFAVALDGATNGCNAILVFNTVTNQWESAPDWWDSDTFRINALHVTSYAGNQRLYALDYVNKRIYLLYEGAADQIGSEILPIKDVIETRGYTLGEKTCFKRFNRAAIGLSTAEPSTVITAITDGVNEEKLLTTFTRNPLKFYTHARPDFDPAIDSSTEPYREDYNLGNFAGEDFDELPDGPITVLPGSADTGVPVILGPKQEALIRPSVRVNGRWVSFRVENNSGQCDVLATAVEGRRVREIATAA